MAKKYNAQKSTTGTAPTGIALFFSDNREILLVTAIALTSAALLFFVFKNHIGTGVALLFAVLAFFVFRRGVAKGDRIAKAYFNAQLENVNREHEDRVLELMRSQDDLKHDLGRSLYDLTKAAKNLSGSLESCRIVPDGHIQVPLNEGVSHHRVGHNYILRIERIFEHRYVAQRALCRDLEPNEVVHHIFGPATDNNKEENLCVMDATKHKLFHSHLEWQREKEKRFPSIQHQKHLLKHEFSGILIEEALAKKQVAFPPLPSWHENSAEVAPTTGDKS